MKRLLTTLALIIITLMATGYSYAYRNGGIHINCYCHCYCNVKFTQVITWDNEIEKDVAAITATIEGCNDDTIEAYITNGYPCYTAYINYTIKNIGCKPIHFNSLTIINPNPEALEITTTNHTCTWLSPYETVQGTTTIHILQQAKEDWQYRFQIKIGVECRQECHLRTIGFWKNQFAKALFRRGRLTIPTATLEHYLDRISSQSEIFDFTGSCREKFWQAIAILRTRFRSSMEAKLNAQLLALWLNYVAGWTDGYTYEGMNAWQIIQGSENVLLSHETEEYEYWKDMCDGFNNLGGW